MEQLTKYGFELEFKELAENCTKLKPSTARRKASKLFNKYREIIAYSKYDMDYYEKQTKKYRLLFNTLKTKKVSYSKGDTTNGYLLLKDVEQIEVSNTYVKLTTKSGREIELSSDFTYLKELFN